MKNKVRSVPLLLSWWQRIIMCSLELFKVSSHLQALWIINNNFLQLKEEEKWNRSKSRDSRRQEMKSKEKLQFLKEEFPQRNHWLLHKLLNKKQLERCFKIRKIGSYKRKFSNYRVSLLKTIIKSMI
jgi:hypothetical protein